MSDTSGGTSPFGSFPGAGGFPQGGGIMENMWDMMKLNPFAAAAMPGGGGSPSLSMMSDMLAPLTNVEELDKRIKDMRAVEQWLKLNLNMLQSAIQALEVQRATLATLRAFGAFAQDSVDKARTASAGAAESAAASWPTPSQEVPREASKEASKDEEGAAATSQTGVNDPAFDPSGWWNVLKSQFNNLATLALSQAAQSAAASGAAASSTAAEGEGQHAKAASEPKKPTVKKAPAKKAAAKKKEL
jgi:hypothetical protein